MYLKDATWGYLLITFTYLRIASAKIAQASLNGNIIIAHYIHPCNSTESACLIKATQDAIPFFVKGEPALGLPVLDPFYIKEVSITLPGGLKVTYLDGRVSGFRKCIVDKVFSNLVEKRFILGFHCNLTIKGQYTANGKILLFPINGEGDAKIKLVNLRMEVDINTEYLKDAQGRNHFAIKNHKYTFDYGDKVSFVLTNLFKGSPELSNTVLAFLNENWRLVADEFGKPLVEYSVNLALDTISNFFKAVPYEELINVPFPFKD